MTLDEKNPILVKAYRIYFDEIAKHLHEASSVLADATALSSESRYAVSARFHTIRGGAGFFGLSAIAEVAGKLEYLLARPDLDLRAEKEGIDELLHHLETLAGGLPPPEPGVP